jgi:hypothetical protein
MICKNKQISGKNIPESTISELVRNNPNLISLWLKNLKGCIFTTAFADALINSCSKIVSLRIVTEKVADISPFSFIQQIRDKFPEVWRMYIYKINDFKSIEFKSALMMSFREGYEVQFSGNLEHKLINSWLCEVKTPPFLSFCYSNSLTRDLITTVSECYSDLEDIQFWDCRHKSYTADVFEPIITNCQQLKKIEFYGCNCKLYKVLLSPNNLTNITMSASDHNTKLTTKQVLAVLIANPYLIYFKTDCTKTVDKVFLLAYLRGQNRFVDLNVTIY